MVITNPTAMESVNPKISNTSNPFIILRPLLMPVSHRSCSVVSLTKTEAVLSK